jgi:hypothetical protein
MLATHETLDYPIIGYNVIEEWVKKDEVPDQIVIEKAASFPDVNCENIQSPWFTSDLLNTCVSWWPLTGLSCLVVPPKQLLVLSAVHIQDLSKCAYQYFLNLVVNSHG